MRRAAVTGVGAYVPKGILTNKDLESIVETSDEWITERTGIKERRIAAKREATSDLALEAAKIALKSAGVRPRQLDYIIFATATPDMPFPATACILQHKLGAKHAACFDVAAGCSGFIYALSVAEKFMLSGEVNNILVVGADMLSRVLDWSDRGTCILFGDGAGAVVLSARDGDRGIISTIIKSDGSYGDMLKMPGGGSLNPASYESIDNKLHFLKMSGNEVFKKAVKSMEDIAAEILEKNGFEGKDVDLLVPHQANLRIIHAVERRTNIPENRTYINVHKYGNTSAASIPIALYEACERGFLRQRDLVLCVAFGAGFTWGAGLVRW
jgi:3-oxoacyl-[acyl-carrier-protein] synthase-3